MNISELIKELEELRERTADLTVVKKRNGEEITGVYSYGAHYCLLTSDLDTMQDEIVRYVKNIGDLERIAQYILNENLNDVIHEILKQTRDISMELKYIPKDEVLLKRTINIPYLHLEVYNDSNQIFLENIRKIHGEFDYCLSICYYSLTDYDMKTYEFPLNKEKNMFL